VTVRLILSEYQSTIVELDDGDARLLAATAGNALTVTVGPSPGRWSVMATDRVGTVVTTGVEVLIRPKIPLHNLFLLLDADVPADAWMVETFGLGTDPDLLPAIAAFFARAATRALAKGPRRDYLRADERLVTLRGRIDLAAQLRTPGLASPIACSYDDYTADIIENRALVAALGRLLHLPGVTPTTRRNLTRVALALAEVSAIAVSPEAVDRIVITRLNRHYAPALRLASVILRNTSLQDRVGSAPASSFLLSTPLLFQRWVTGRLRRALVADLHVRDEPPVKLDVAGRITMSPDLVFDRHDAAVYVGDLKYKLSSGLARSGDYYQLLAYSTALRLSEGVLIYCQADGEAPEHEATVAATGSRLWTYRLPMTGTNADVEAAVVALGEWLKGRVRRGSTALTATGVS
jgi:5-methylcytosine-specific restriction enzyme subunit McrC